MNCRINRARDWTARLLLHHAGHLGGSSWVTFTYSPLNLPLVDGLATLRPVDMRNFIRRLRREVGPLRYCYVGEYGERTMRPHYHALIWAGVSSAYLPPLISSCWDSGFTSFGEVAQESIIYTISYILKRMTSSTDPRLGGRHPEFARFSHGLGAAALSELRRSARPGQDGVLELPREFRLSGYVWPMPSYIREKLEAEGYAFNRPASEVQEEAFVLALRLHSRDVAVAALPAYRTEVSKVKEQRRERARLRLARKLPTFGSKKLETL